MSNISRTPGNHRTLDPGSNEGIVRSFVRSNEGHIVEAQDGGAQRKLSRTAQNQDIIDLGALQGVDQSAKVLGVDQRNWDSSPVL